MKGAVVAFYGAIAFIGLPYIMSDCKTLIQALQCHDNDAKIQYINLDITDFIFAEDGSAHHEGHVQMELTKMLCPTEKPSDDNHDHHHHFAEEEIKCSVEVKFIR